MFKPQSDCIILAFSKLLEDFNLKSIAVHLRHAKDLLPGSIVRVALDEDNFNITSKIREAPQSTLDIAPFVARGNNARQARRVIGNYRAPYGHVNETHPPKERYQAEDPVENVAQSEQAKRAIDFRLLPAF